MNRALESHLNIISNLVGRRNAEASDVLSLNDLHAVESRVKGLKTRYFSMLDTDMLKLSPKVVKTGEIGCRGYNIEKLVMESLDGYFVPMNLYAPRGGSYARGVPGGGGAKRPAILVNMGHYIEGKALPENQMMCANLALLGFMALTFDPICQGERDMFPERTHEHGKKDMWVVEQHMKVGNQCYLLGDNSISYFINDAVKAVDYLVSRQDVDADRIGVTGQSGGGTMSYLLAALDGRIKAAAPIHCLSTMDRICENSIGDSEQSMIDMLYDGFDTADFLWMIAPRPLFISAGTRDFFSIEGVREIYKELKRVYKLLGHEENIELCEIDTGHVISREVRESVYGFFNTVFPREPYYGGGSEIQGREQSTPVFLPEQLACGVKELKGRTPLDCNLVRLDNITTLRRERNMSPENIIDVMKKLFRLKDSGCEQMEHFCRDCSVNSGNGENGCRRYVFRDRDGLSFEVETDIKADRPDTIVYIDLEDRIKLPPADGGNFLKETADAFCMDTGEAIPVGTKSNRAVIRPFGSRKDSYKSDAAYDDETRLAYQGIVSGKSIFGIRLAQILYALDFINQNVQKGAYGKLQIRGRRQGALLGAFACIMRHSVSKVFCEELIYSFSMLFGKADYLLNETDIIPGILKEFDIDILVNSLGERIDVISYVDEMREIHLQGVGR
ncbi:MAG: acetylxylan esterase [Clostridiaceae bacterium]